MEPRIGQEVYAVNIQIGQVYKVVISPRSRRVSAVIVRGKLPDPQQERTVEVPAERVDLVSTAVFLTLTALECAQLPDFNPANFVTPDAAWEPPFPYYREEVLLDLDRGREAQLEASRSSVVLAKRDQPEALAGQPAGLLPIHRGQTVRYRSGEIGAVDHGLQYETQERQLPHR